MSEKPKYLYTGRLLEKMGENGVDEKKSVPIKGSYYLTEAAAVLGTIKFADSIGLMQYEGIRVSPYPVVSQEARRKIEGLPENADISFYDGQMRYDLLGVQPDRSQPALEVRRDDVVGKSPEEVQRIIDTIRVFAEQPILGQAWSVIVETMDGAAKLKSVNE